MGENIVKECNCKFILFKGKINEEIEKIKLIEGQKVNYINFNELKDIKIDFIQKIYISK